MLEAIHIENTLTSSVGGVSTSIGMDLAARSASEHDYNLTFAEIGRAASFHAILMPRATIWTSPSRLWIYGATDRSRSTTDVKR